MNLKGAKPERFGALASGLYRSWGQSTLEPLYRRVLAEIPIERGHLLDVGCGPGRLAQLLAQSRPALEVVGLDASPDMIREARRGPKLPNLAFREGTVESTNCHREFDFAVTLLSFHHWEEPRQGLEAVYRALAPGGRFWIYEPNPQAANDEIQRDRAPLWGLLRLPGWLQRRISRGHGFSSREIDAVVRPLVAQTSFGGCEVCRQGSTFRLELRKI